MFWCICTCFQTTRIFLFQKRYFWTSGVFKNVFACICAYFQTTRNIYSKMIFLTFRSAKIRVLMHLRILPEHQ
jgi:hypothetical protein